MKKLAIFLVIGLMLCAFSTANATLLGIRSYSANVPDVQFDSGGSITYTASTDLFIVEAGDQVLFMEKDPAVQFGLTNLVDFYLELTVDENGNLVSTADNYMEEIVTEDFSFTYKGTTYYFYEGDVFLKGTVTAFGWAPILDYFEFDWTMTLDPTSEMVVNGIWPTTLPTGGYVDSKSISWNAWQEDLDGQTEKGDKYPVPEPATMLLLGSGLIGLAGYARRRFHKK